MVYFENTGGETLSTQKALNASFGYGTGQKYLSGTDTDSANTFFCIMILADTTFTALTDNGVAGGFGVHTIITDFTAGQILYGQFTNIELSSGVIKCFSKDAII